MTITELPKINILKHCLYFPNLSKWLALQFLANITLAEGWLVPELQDQRPLFMPPLEESPIPFAPWKIILKFNTLGTNNEAWGRSLVIHTVSCTPTTIELVCIIDCSRRKILANQARHILDWKKPYDLIWNYKICISMHKKKHHITSKTVAGRTLWKLLSWSCLAETKCWFARSLLAPHHSLQTQKSKENRPPNGLSQNRWLSIVWPVQLVPTWRRKASRGSMGRNWKTGGWILIKKILHT